MISTNLARSIAEGISSYRCTSAACPHKGRLVRVIRMAIGLQGSSCVLGESGPRQTYFLR